MTELEQVSTEVGKKKEPDFFHLKTRVNRQIKKKSPSEAQEPQTKCFYNFFV